VLGGAHQDDQLIRVVAAGGADGLLAAEAIKKGGE
jgi:hypothetical protein